MVRNEVRSTITKQGAIENKLVTTEIKNGQDLKPEQFTDTKVWDPVFSLYCTFENDKLVQWICPELILQRGDTSKTNKDIELK